MLSVSFWLVFALVFAAVLGFAEAGLSVVSGLHVRRVRRVPVDSPREPTAARGSERVSTLKRAA